MLAIKNHISPKHLPHLIPAALFAYLALKHTRILSPTYIEGVESTKMEKFLNASCFVTCAATSVYALGMATYLHNNSQYKACALYLVEGILVGLINFASREKVVFSGQGGSLDMDYINENNRC